jgi:acetyl-CoA decarbonylase/synthase complex subunit gamma
VREACETTDMGIVLISEDMDALFSARDICAERNPLLYPVTKTNIDEVIPRLKGKPAPVGVRVDSIEQLTMLTSTLKNEGIEEIVLDPNSHNMLEGIRDQTFLRRAALKQNFRPLGYPTMAFPCFMTDSSLKEALIASMFVIKYAGIIVLSNLDQHSLFPLLVQRLGIYTNPQMPLSIEEKLYEIGMPGEDSPVLLSSNWALTYLILSSAIEDTGIPAYLCAKSIEEADVLCWCHHCLRSTQAGTLNINDTAQFIEKCGIGKRVTHRKLVIPGRASKFKAELVRALPEWEIVTGPEEDAKVAVFLPDYAESLRK